MIETCVCGCRDSTHGEFNGIAVATCRSCGILRQVVDMTSKELFAWYRDQYFVGVYNHDYAHDRVVAEQRLIAYRKRGVVFNERTRVLDFGSGNGAFVDALRKQKVPAYGCDPHNSHEWTYTDPLDEVMFPPDYFDVAVFHDSLEHVYDPRHVLNETCRMLKASGRIIIDFPRYFHDSGKHHWKKTEHLWFFNNKQVRHLLDVCGFSVDKVYMPISSKLVFIATKKPVGKRARILVPPGIGDIYWVACKLQAFIKKHDLGVPDVFIACTNGEKQRSLPYVERLPFVRAAGFHVEDIRRNKLWNRAYKQDGSGIFKNVLGFDFFLSANGPFRFDKTLEQIMPGYDTNRYPPMFVSIDECHATVVYKKLFGDYIVAFFTYHGMYRRWLKEFPITKIYKTMRDITEQTGMRFVLTGAEWDHSRDAGVAEVNEQLMSIHDCSGDSFLVDLVGKTSLPGYFALLRGARGCLGFCGGNTILAPTFGVPTVILWNNYFRPTFWRNCCPPDTVGRLYRPITTTATVNQVVKSFTEATQWSSG